MICVASSARVSFSGSQAPSATAHPARPAGGGVIHQGRRACSCSGLAVLDPALPPELVGRTPLAIAWRRFNQALDTFIDRQVFAA